MAQNRTPENRPFGNTVDSHTTETSSVSSTSATADAQGSPSFPGNLGHQYDSPSATSIPHAGRERALEENTQSGSVSPVSKTRKNRRWYSRLSRLFNPRAHSNLVPKPKGLVSSAARRPSASRNRYSHHPDTHHDTEDSDQPRPSVDTVSNEIRVTRREILQHTGDALDLDEDNENTADDSEEPVLSPEEIAAILQNHERHVRFDPAPAHLVPFGHEHSWLSKNQSRLVSEIHFSTLESNDPIEDHCAIHRWRNRLIFGVFDGHGGPECSRMVSRHLSRYVIAWMAKAAKNYRGSVYTSDGRLTDSYLRTMTRAISGAFAKMDEDISSIPQLIFPRLGEDEYDHVEGKGMLRDSRNTVAASSGGRKLRGRTLKTIFSPSQIRHLLKPAMTGSVGILCVLDEAHSVLYVANVGDSRCVLGHRLPDGRYRAIPLSTDHHPRNEEELRRLLALHPGEEQTIAAPHPIAGGLRLLGGLAPSRAFGDNVYKWSIKRQRTILSRFFQSSNHSCEKTPPHYYTPPYLTAKPEVKIRQIHSGDQFLILASDGLWDELSNSEVVFLVAEFLNRRAERQHEGRRRAKAAPPERKTWESELEPSVDRNRSPSTSVAERTAESSGHGPPDGGEDDLRSSPLNGTGVDSGVVFNSDDGPGQRLSTMSQLKPQASQADPTNSARTSDDQHLTSQNNVSAYKSRTGTPSERTRSSFERSLASSVASHAEHSPADFPSSAQPHKESPSEHRRQHNSSERVASGSSDGLDGPAARANSGPSSKREPVGSHGLWLEEEDHSECDVIDMDSLRTSDRFAFVDDNVATHLVRNTVGAGNHVLVAESLACSYPDCREYRDDITVFVVLLRAGKEGDNLDEGHDMEVLPLKLAQRAPTGSMGHPSTVGAVQQNKTRSSMKHKNAWIGPVGNAGREGMHVVSLDEDHSPPNSVPEHPEIETRRGHSSTFPGYHASSTAGVDLAKVASTIHPAPRGTEFDLVPWSDITSGRVNQVEDYISGKLKLGQHS